MAKRLSQITMLLGLLMILGGIGLLIGNTMESRAAGAQSAAILTQIKAQAPQPAAAADSPPEAPGPVPEAGSMPVVTIDGIGYVGTLSIPCLDLELPVIDPWSYENLQSAPCRYSGSLAADDLVICGHSYPAHFGKLEKIPVGEALFFTAMDGTVYRYQAIAVELLEPTAIEEMTAGNYPLTLFSCTPDGRRRVTLRCSMVTE